MNDTDEDRTPWLLASGGSRKYDKVELEPVRKVLQTLRTHAERVVRRWTSTYTNARLEGLNGLFQAARARARGYRNTETFMTMIYLIASPAGKILEST